MAEIRINATGGVKLYDADDSHYAQIVAGTITSNTDVMTLGHAAVVMGTKLDMNGSNLVLDADADTYLDTGTDDTIKVYVSGAHDLTIGANAINVLSGTTLTIDSGATIANSGTATGFSSADPASADGDSLGTASLEWSDLFLADGGIIKFGNDQDTLLTHTDGTGLTLNSTNKLCFGDAASYIHQSSDGVLKIDGEATVDIDATTAVTIAAANVPVTVGGIPFYYGDTGSIYTHNVSGTDSTATQNTSYGLTALDAITTGDSNTAIGFDAGGAATTGGSNTFIGRGAAGGAAVTGSNNVAIGRDAARPITSAAENVVIGHNSGAGMTSASDNVIIGKNAGNACTTGDKNIIIGRDAMDAFDTEESNIGIGYNAMGGAVAGGEYNVAIGNYNLEDLTSADSNVAIGYSAAINITTGGTNTIIGRSAGAALTTGLDSVLIGAYAGNAIVGADQNVCVGSSAGAGLTSGATNTFIGQGAGDAMQTGSNNTCIGVNCDASANDVSNAISLGAAVNAAANDFSFGKASNVVTNDFDADADWSRSSDIRLKRNIQDTTLGLDFINDLRPVKFQWKPSNEVPKEMKAEYNEVNQKNLDIVSHGFIAQEVKEAIDKYGDTTFGGWHLDKTDNETQRVKKNMFVMPLIKAVQELTARVKELEAK